MSAKPSLDSIFCSAIELESPDDRRAFIDEACGEDAELRKHVERLLRAHFHGGSILDAPVVGQALQPAEGADFDLRERLGETAGAVIGPYKLLEPLGEGGMGMVWLAEQTEPIQRRVAVKVIKAGMDSKQVLTRFEAERQALAIMDHPNIARVLDAGTTGAGRPYFVMELVEGTPITSFCDDEHLSVRERLELFGDVCRAVQHAHQKGIIHRDLKPNNVLVALYDGKPAPKVIDFGVAKATAPSLTDQSLVTGFGTIVGTLEYMSPEQAEVNPPLDIDTRSDIYSLGVLLYELLAGSPPFTCKELEKAGMLEMLQVIREREPSKPSTKLSTADGLPTLAANRGTEPENLTELVRGELDWIVMKALEKDRARRYESAIDFAADVQRYLMDEPVLACPPSVGYRLRKFVRRNKGPVLAVSLVVVALLIGLIGTTWGLFWALEERDGKEQARQAAEVNEHKAETSATEARNAETDARIAEGKARKAETEARTAEGKARTAEAHERKAKELAQARLDQMEKASLLLATLLTDAAQSRSDAAAKPAKVFFAERLDYVMRQLDFETIDDPLILAKVQSTFGTCYWHLGFALKGIPLLEKAVKTRKDNLGPGHAETMESMINLAACYRVVKRPTASLPLYEDMLRVNKDKLGPDHAETLNSMDVLALGYMEAGRAPDAVKLVEEVARRRKPDDPRYFASREARAAVYQAAGRKAEALALREEAVQRYKDKFGPDHDMTLSGMAQLASSYKANGKFDEAVSMCESHLKLTRAKFGPDQSRSLFSMNDLASTLMAAGRTKDALPVLTDAVPRMRKNLGLQNIAMQDAVRNLIACHEKHDQYAQAEPLHRELTAHWKQQSGPNSTAYANRLVFLGRNLLKQSKPALAEPVLRECVTIRTKYGPNLWTTFEAKSLLGAALLDQKKYTDAEPFLLGAYRSMKDGEAKTPGKIVSVSTLERLIRLYEAVGDADKAAKWRKELEDTNKRNKEKIGSNPL